MIPITTRDKDSKELKEENQKKIKKMYAIPKDRILKDFEVENIFLTKHPMPKNKFITLKEM